MYGNIGRACIYVIYSIDTLGHGYYLYISFNYLPLSDCVSLIW